MGEIARESPGALQGLEDGLCQALVKELKGEVSTNRRNAAFACGTVLQAAAQNGTIAQLAGRVNNILQVRRVLLLLYGCSRVQLATHQLVLTSALLLMTMAQSKYTAS